MKKLFFITFCVSTIHVSAQNAEGYSLQQAQDYAIKSSPLIKNSLIDIQIYQEKVKEVRAIGLPQINAEGSFQNFINIPTNVIPAAAFDPTAPPDLLIGVQFGTNNNASGSVTLTQLIFDGSYLVGLQATKSLTLLQNTLEQKTEIDVRSEVARSYYTAVVADENIKTLEQTIANLEKLKNETAAIKKEGLIEQQDVDQISLTVETMRNNLTRAKSMRDMAYRLLKLNMGMDVEASITLSESADSFIKQTTETIASQELNLSNNIDHSLLQTQLTLSELNIKNYKMKYYPSVGGFFTHSYTAFRNDLDFFSKPWYPATIWGVKVSIPIFSSGMRMAKVQQATLEMEKAKNNLERADQGIKLQAANAKLNYNFAMESLNTQKKSLELSQSIQDKTLVKYKEGVVGSMELNQAQMQYLSSQANYINAMLGVLNAKAEMDKIFYIYTPTK